MRIDFITEDSSEELRRIHNYCFGPQEEDWFEPGMCLGVFDGGRLAASLKIIPYEMFFWGTPVKMGGIGAVATLPEYRIRQCAAGLLKKSLTVMKERGQVFSMLGPFSYAFYRKYGWELAFHYLEYILPVEDFRDFGSGAGGFRPLGVADMTRVKAVYEEFARQYNGAVKRSEHQWRDLFTSHERRKSHCYGYEDNHGRLQGYMFYQIREGRFLLHELVYAGRAAKEELFRFVYLHRAQAQKFVWKAPVDDGSFLLLAEPPETRKLVPGMMMRVVDVKAALECYPFPPCCRLVFTLKVDDPWAPWNNRRFQVAVKDGGAKVQAARVPTADKEPETDVSCSIQVFSQVISGFVGMKKNRELGRITGKDEKALNEIEQLFPSKATYMNDCF